MTWSEYGVPLLIIAVLIALNGLFVAAEFAIVGVSRAELAGVDRERRRAARLARRVLRDPRRQDRFIATAQLGITLASLGLGMYGEHIVAGWIAEALEGWGAGRWVAAHAVASVLAVALLTYFHIVVGEMVPKSIALQRARATVLWIVPVMRIIQLSVYPLVVVLNGLGNVVLRLVGIDRTHPPTQYRTAEELAYVVRESEAGGLIHRTAAGVVRELLEFGELTAGEVMVPRVRVVGIPLGARLDMIAAIVKTAPHTRYPVYAGTVDDVVGVLHVRDILRQPVASGEALRPEWLRPATFVPATARMERVLSAMREVRSQLVVIMDEHGGTAGIVTLEDLFEEVVGDITEKAGETPEIVVLAPGVVRANGAARISDVGDVLGVILEHPEVDTVSGLVLAVLERPAVRGDALVYEGVRFEVAETRGRGVASCVASLEGRPPKVGGIA